MRRGASDAFWASAVQWARLGVGGVVFLIAARQLPLADIGAFGIASAPLRVLQVIHKGGIEDAATITPPDEVEMQAALQGLSLIAGLAATLVALTLAPLLAMIDAGTGVAAMALALAPVSLAHGAGAVADGILRRSGRFRALALRTLAGQLVAAALAVVALSVGAGIWSLVIFALAQSAIAAALAVAMAGWPGITASRQIRKAALAQVLPLVGRVLAGAAVQPALQIAIGASAGLVAAGVWQIATRILALLEALTLVPLRLVALPRLAAGGRAELPTLMTTAALAATWVMGGTALAAPTILMALLGPHDPAVTTALRLLCAGAVAGSAVAVLNQALIGSGHGRAALRVALISAATALAAGAIALSLSSSRPAESLALSQVVAGLVPLALLQRETAFGPDQLLRALRPWAGLAAIAPAVWFSAHLAAPLPAVVSLVAQVLAGTAALAIVLPLLAPNQRLWR
jgi:O-antigen/teichoic acid export membrane protein